MRVIAERWHGGDDANRKRWHGGADANKRTKFNFDNQTNVMEIAVLC